MASTPTGIRRLAALSALLVALLVAPVAQADEFCFPDTAVDASCDSAPGTFQQTLTAAQNMAGPDSVLLGAGNFMIPKNQAGYGDTDPGNSVQIIGRGIGATTLTLSDTTMAATAMNFSASADSIMRDLSFVIPANEAPGTGDTVLNLGGSATTRNVSVTGPDATNTSGALIHGDAVLDDSTIDLETTNSEANIAVRTSGTQPLITDSTLIADSGVSPLGAVNPTVERSTIEALVGIDLQSDSIVVRNTVIDLGSLNGAIGISAANFNESSSPLTVTGDHLTIVGGGANSIGARAIGDSNGGVGVFGTDPENGINDGETGTVNLSNTLISGPETAVFAAADRSEVANVTTSYSNYTAPAVEDDDLNDGQSMGNATVTETNKTTHAMPGFVSTTDFHLLPSSPLIDIGDPAAPAMGTTDIDGDARALDGSFNCPFVQRRDIGADEYAGATQGSTGCPTPTQTTPATTSENPECEPLRQKIKRLTRKIRQADDRVRKRTLKRKRRNARNRLAALGCSA